MSVATAAAAPAEWIDCRAAARILNVTPDNVRNLRKQGVLSSRELPGVRQKYRKDEVERLAQECIKPGKVSETK